MRRSALGVLALLVAVPTGLVSTAQPASAETVSVPSLAGLVADDVHGRVFIGNRDTGTVLATDYSGNLVDSAAGIDGVTDLALSPDSQVLYAASWTTHEVVALDPATLNEITRYTTATTHGPRHLAFAGGKVWFSYGDQWSGNLGSINPGTGAVTMNQYPSRVWGQAILDGASGKPDSLAVGETGLSTDSMAVLDVSGAAPVETAFHGGNYTLNDGIGDIDLVPGAAQVLVNGKEKQAYADGGFTAAGAYAGGDQADISATGLVATATDSQVKVFKPGVPVPVNTFSGGADALAWAPDESKLFVLTRTGGYGTPYALGVLDAPAVAKPTLTVTAPSSAPRAQQLTVNGTIASAVPFAADPTLTVLRKDLEHPSGTALPDVQVAPDGSWSFPDTPTVGGSVTYVVSYAGDADHQSVTSQDGVAVSRTTPSLTLRPGTATYSYGKQVTFTAHLGTTYQNRTVQIWVDPAGSDKPRTLVKSGVVNSNGDIAATVTLSRNTAVSAVYAGDARTAPRTVSVAANTKVRISVAVTRQYKTAAIGSHRYYWFHKATSPLLTTAMTPYPGRQVRMDFQVHVNGTWQNADSAYFELGAGGKAPVVIETPNRVGIKARVRSSYIRGTSGDSVNTTTMGGWTYLYWTR